jgi:NAD(P)-dependent dehydrogenase (short-subunit alcohol dehydrogenase family)
MIDLAGRPVAITGASSGIGMATALACASAGMRVAVAARRQDRLHALVEQIHRHSAAAHPQAIAVRVDVADPDDCRRLVERTMESFGSIHALVANAGYSLERAAHETSDAELRAIFETNFFGTLNTIRPALPHMLAANAGHIVIVSSCLSKLGTPFHSAYSATKAAQDHLARGMRLELADRGIRVSSVHPIGTRTELFSVMDSHSGGSAALHTPERFMQPPERIARAIVRELRRGRGGEVWTSTTVRLAMALGTACPGLADRLLQAHVARRGRYYRPAAGEHPQ